MNSDSQQKAEKIESNDEKDSAPNSWLTPAPEEVVGPSLALQQLQKDSSQHQQCRSTDRVTYSSLLWQTMCNIPRLVQTQSESIVKLFLQFLSKHYPTLYRHVREPLLGDQPLASEKVYQGNHKLTNNRLMDYLKLFALFNNPASLPSANLLKEVYIRYSLQSLLLIFLYPN